MTGVNFPGTKEDDAINTKNLGVEWERGKPVLIHYKEFLLNIFQEDL